MIAATRVVALSCHSWMYSKRQVTQRRNPLRNLVGQDTVIVIAVVAIAAVIMKVIYGNRR